MVSLYQNSKNKRKTKDTKDAKIRGHNMRNHKLFLFHHGLRCNRDKIDVNSSSFGHERVSQEKTTAI